MLLESCDLTATNEQPETEGYNEQRREQSAEARTETTLELGWIGWSCPELRREWSFQITSLAFRHTAKPQWLTPLIANVLSSINPTCWAEPGTRRCTGSTARCKILRICRLSWDGGPFTVRCPHQERDKMPTCECHWQRKHEPPLSSVDRRGCQGWRCERAIGDGRSLRGASSVML